MNETYHGGATRWTSQTDQFNFTKLSCLRRENSLGLGVGYSAGRGVGLSVGEGVGFSAVVMKVHKGEKFLCEPQ